MAFRPPSKSAEYFTGSRMTDAAAAFLPKSRAAVSSVGDEFGRQTALNIAETEADVIEFQGDQRAKTLETRGEALDEVNKAKIAGNRQKGVGEAVKGVLSVGLGLLAASDRRIKNTIEELDNAVSLLKELRPVSFYYNKGYGTDSDRLHYGFIAQEYAEHMPDATYTDDDTGMLCINTMELISILVKANQELEERIARLEVKDKLAGAVR